MHAKIKRKARKALRDLIKQGVNSKDALKQVQKQYIKDVKAIMADDINGMKKGFISEAKLSKMAVGTVTLSKALNAHSSDIERNVSRIIKQHAQGLHNARQLALELFEGYRVTKNPLDNSIQLPKYLQKPFNDLQAKQLKTPALKAAYLKLINAKTDVQIEKSLKIAMYERNRYFANRIAQTELHRIRTQHKAQEMIDDDGIDYVQVRLSASHPVYDICDYHANLDSYGLGKGVYPKNKAPSPPFHPHCRCIIAPIINIKKKPKLIKKAQNNLMQSLNALQQVRVLGSKRKRGQWLRGDSVLSLVDASKPIKYKTKLLEDINNKAVVADLQGRELLVSNKGVKISVMKKSEKIDKGILYSIKRTNWAKSKYDAKISGSIDDVQSHASYEKAKSGDYLSAVTLSKSFISNETLIKNYNNPILLAVTAEEKAGKNAIPLGMASVIQKATKWDLASSIYQINKAGHTKSTGWHRIATPAIFEGHVIKNGEYLILDDFIGMGGTVANLKSFIERSGGKVVGYEILTGSEQSSKLYLRSKTLTELRDKHGHFEKEFKQILGFEYDGLTESEAQYLLRSATSERIRNQIIKAIYKRNN